MDGCDWFEEGRVDGGEREAGEEEGEREVGEERESEEERGGGWGLAWSP